MHFTYLREVVWSMFSSCCTSNEICLSINMEEDVAGGAIRISHLLVEGRLNFDTKMKNVGVYNYLPQDIFGKKRKHYFITCSGKMMFSIPIEEQYITNQLTADHQKENWKVKHQNEQYHQMSFFEPLKGMAHF